MKRVALRKLADRLATVPARKYFHGHFVGFGGTTHCAGGWAAAWGMVGLSINRQSRICYRGRRYHNPFNALGRAFGLTEGQVSYLFGFGANGSNRRSSVVRRIRAMAESRA